MQIALEETGWSQGNCKHFEITWHWITHKTKSPKSKKLWWEKVGSDRRSWSKKSPGWTQTHLNLDRDHTWGKWEKPGVHLLVKKTLGIWHCHLKVVIGPSKVTSNSHSLMQDERFFMKSENRIPSINFLPLVWCQHPRKRTWHHYLGWKVQVSGADMVGKSIVFVRWKYSLEILWEGF